MVAERAGRVLPPLVGFHPVENLIRAMDELI